MARRTATENLESKLQVYETIHLDPPLAKVCCPHCQGRFTIEGRLWREPLMSVVDKTLEIQGRPCPYCFKPSLIPLEFYPKQVRARYAAKRS